MEKQRIQIDLLPSQFVKDDGTFDKDEALKLCGKIAGVCYDKEGFHHLENEPSEKTMRRIERTLNNGHHSVYDHVSIIFNIQNIPKILAMVLNNEKQYTTSEKSARYTKVERKEGSIITPAEERLYNKWIDIFKIKITEQYGGIYNASKIEKLAQENARYLVTVFMPTQMIYTTTLRQINYILSWMEEYIMSHDTHNPFENKLSFAMDQFINALISKNILVAGLMKNEKNRYLSLFGQNLDSKQDIFSDVYSVTYKGSLAQLAQAQRYRTLDYQMEFLKEEEYFIPPIIASDKTLVEEWLGDMNMVKGVTPQGTLVRINEAGKYGDFILKCKERLCSEAQLEVMEQTRQTLLAYKKALESSCNPLASDIAKYSHGARCTFPDFTCPNDCGFKEGKTLVRKI